MRVSSTLSKLNITAFYWTWKFAEFYLFKISGTYEKVEDEEEEVYETVNVFKLKQFLPNLRIVNLWGVSFPSREMNKKTIVS